MLHKQENKQYLDLLHYFIHYLQRSKSGEDAGANNSFAFQMEQMLGKK